MSWKRHFAVAFLLSASLLGTALGFLPQDRLASMPADDLARRKNILEGQCALCHGMAAAGSRGPALNQAKLPPADDNFSLFRINKLSMPDSEMPQFGQLSDPGI